MARKRDRANRAGPSRQQLVARQTELYVGPIPSAQQLERYEQIHPGLADRIVKMAEDQSGHRRAMERLVIDGNVGAQTRGQWCGLTLGLAVVAAGVWVVDSGRPVLGISTVLGAVVTLAIAFVTGRVLQWKERRDRREEAMRR